MKKLRKLKMSEKVKEKIENPETEKTMVEEKTKENKPEKKTKEQKEENWGILHIYSSYNNTHLHVTDLTGSETIAKVTGGMVTKSDRLKANPNIAMAAAKQISEECHRKEITALYVKLRAVGGHNGPMTPGPGSQAAIKMLTRYGIKLGRIEDVTPIPHDSCRKKGGKRGRRV
jgi:small subunit ribosomal protein S11